jgi:esterase/lipase
MINPHLFLPSGLNSTFHGANGSFQDYIQEMQNLIKVGRVDLNTTFANKIIEMNSPFEYRPQKPYQKGVLLIHGLFDSPFTMRDIGKTFLSQNFLVRSILLPGHGTVPGDLLNMHYTEWLKAVEYGVKGLSQEVEDVYLLGFSTGGSLAIIHALQNPQIKGLILIAPAIKPKPLSAYFILLLPLLARLYPPALWYQKRPSKSCVKYESFPSNAPIQTWLLMIEIMLANLKMHRLIMPLLIIASEDDEVISAQGSLHFFIKQKNPKNQFLLYTNSEKKIDDKRVIQRKSAYPEQKILNFAHISLPFAPNNIHFGKNGEYQDFMHYHNNPPPGEIYLGADSKENLKNHVIQRLSYNPDFDGMMQYINQFIDQI